MTVRDVDSLLAVNDFIAEILRAPAVRKSACRTAALPVRVRTNNGGYSRDDVCPASSYNKSFAA